MLHIKTFDSTRSVAQKNTRRAQRKNNSQKRRMLVELLDERKLMAADISFVNGAMEIEGTNDRDIIQIEGSSSSLGHVTIKNSSGSILDESYFWGPSLSEIIVRAHGGNDHVENNTDIPSKQWGGEGNDTLLGGTARDELRGDNGHDRLEGHDGNDYLSGWNGNDVVFGGNGNDTIYGGSHDDWLYGENGNDFLAGWSGKDYLFGGDGNDELKGGDHEDRLYGNAGNDLLRGQAGDDFLYGHSGNDTLKGESGNDYLSGSSGNDNLYGGSGEDDLNGHSGDDGLFGGQGQDEMNGGSGDDRFLVTRDADTLFSEDILEDIYSNDAKISFQDGAARVFNFVDGRWSYFEAGTFSDSEIEQVDQAFAELHASTGNTRLLKQAFGGELVFERLGAQTKGNFVNNGVNSGGSKVYLVEGSFAGGVDNLVQTVFHEIGHNWDNENANWSGWKSLSGWRKTLGRDKEEYQVSLGGTWYHKTSAVFARSYGRTDPYEDFATYFAKSMMEDSDWTYQDGANGGTDSSKDAFMESFIDSLKS